MSVPDDVPVKRRNNRKWLIKRVDLYFVCQPVLLTASDEDADRKWDIKVDFATGFPSRGLRAVDTLIGVPVAILYLVRNDVIFPLQRDLYNEGILLLHTQRKEVLKCHSTLVACLTLFYTLQINRHVH